MATNKEINEIILKERISELSNVLKYIPLSKAKEVGDLLDNYIDQIQTATRKDERVQCDAEKEQAVKAERVRVINEIGEAILEYFKTRYTCGRKFIDVSIIQSKLNQLKDSGIIPSTK